MINLARDKYDVLEDYFFGLVGGGVPTTYHAASALAEGDYEEAVYHVGIEAAVLGTQLGMLSFLNWYQGPKYAMSFHKMHQGINVVRGMGISAAAPFVAAVGLGYTAGAVVLTAVSELLFEDGAEIALDLVTDPIKFVDDAILGIVDNITTIVDYYWD